MKNTALVFRGVADIIGRRGQTTPGGLWRITAECEAELDAYEGVRSGLYRKIYITLGTEDGKVHDCLIYQMQRKGFHPPSVWYYETILQGYEDFELDTVYLDRALNEAWQNKTPTEYFRARHARRGGGPLARVTYQEEELENDA